MNMVHPPADPIAAVEPVAPRLLLVEPQPAARTVLQSATRSVAHVVTPTDFPAARECLQNGSFDFLVTDVRLGAYNGLHLVYLAAARGILAWSIVYTELLDVGLAKEVHQAGAFYETRERLRVTIIAYVRGNLPPRDRRERLRGDRRTMFRGGRRCWDHYLAPQAADSFPTSSSSHRLTRRESETREALIRRAPGTSAPAPQPPLHRRGCGRFRLVQPPVALN